MTDDLLYHLTLNTGHVAQTPRSAVAQSVIDQLLPIIDADHGPVPGLPGWYLDFIFPLSTSGARIPGAAFFQIAKEPNLSKQPVVMAFAAWSDAMSQAAWSQVLTGYAPILASLPPGSARQPPAEPPPSPWLAVWLTAAATLAGGVLPLLGDLEYCVAWAMIDA